MIIYTEEAFAVMKVNEFMLLILRLKKEVQERLAKSLEQDGFAEDFMCDTSRARLLFTLTKISPTSSDSS